jgi:NDP-sugar pyrophosphorylase family protein
MDRGEVSAQEHAGAWTDVGTPERLAQLNGAASAQPLPADFLADRQDAPPQERDWR